MKWELDNHKLNQSDYNTLKKSIKFTFSLIDQAKKEIKVNFKNQGKKKDHPSKF